MTAWVPGFQHEELEANQRSHRPSSEASEDTGRLRNVLERGRRWKQPDSFHKGHYWAAGEI